VSYDFTPIRAAMQRYVDENILAGVSYAVLDGRTVVDQACIGWADKERDVALRTDHVFRAFSNTKLITSAAALLLLEEGKFDLDDPVERYIPELAKPRVLKRDEQSILDTEPAKGPITVRHLMTHTSGLSYGLFDPGTLLFNAYNERRVRNPDTPLSDMIDRLAELPLRFHPGTAWEYSVATDVLGRLIEVLSGQPFDAFLKSRIFDRLGMKDTAFWVPEEQRHRLVAYYSGADLLDPMKPGLTRMEAAPYPGAYLKPVARLSGGGGLLSTLPDMIALIRSLLPEGETLLEPQTIRMAMTNQLPADMNVRFANWGEMHGKAHGLAGAVTLAPSAMDPNASVAEFQWGGLAGTHWWISPNHGLSCVLMAQRAMAFWHPFWFEFKNLVLQAARKRP
jgi:CubicO group peptidase (beta-lactamase class C family)